TIELTDDEVQRARRHNPYHGPLCVGCILHSKLPPEPVDPRTLPPGDERLERMVCEALEYVGHAGHNSGGCATWSSESVHVGEMLDWLHEERGGLPIALANWGVDGNPPWRV